MFKHCHVFSLVYGLADRTEGVVSVQVQMITCTETSTPALTSMFPNDRMLNNRNTSLSLCVVSSVMCIWITVNECRLKGYVWTDHHQEALCKLVTFYISNQSHSDQPTPQLIENQMTLFWSLTDNVRQSVNMRNKQT